MKVILVNYKFKYIITIFFGEKIMEWVKSLVLVVVGVIIGFIIYDKFVRKYL